MQLRFIVFLTLLAALNPLMIIAVLVTTIASFSVCNYLNGWGYRHRDEESEYSRRMNYLSEKIKRLYIGKGCPYF